MVGSPSDTRPFLLTKRVVRRSLRSRRFLLPRRAVRESAGACRPDRSLRRGARASAHLVGVRVCLGLVDLAPCDARRHGMDRQIGVRETDLHEVREGGEGPEVASTSRTEGPPGLPPRGSPPPGGTSQSSRRVRSGTSPPISRTCSSTTPDSARRCGSSKGSPRRPPARSGTATKRASRSSFAGLARTPRE